MFLDITDYQNLQHTTNLQVLNFVGVFKYIFWSCFVLFAGNAIYVRRKPSYFLNRIPDSTSLNVILFPINTAAYNEQKTSD